MSNRLKNETSPYLRQHQDNPVDWYPWGPEALEKARQEDKPILLSIGYSACHWCHVMAHESFENPDIARLMNDEFINIKVDREERPDLDQIYQNVAQLMTQSGGWPLTVFLTPDLKPYFGGTYFPPQDRYGRPGFARILIALSQAYRKERDGVMENAQRLCDAIAQLETLSAPSAPREPLAADFDEAARMLLARVDWASGGLGGAPKFPNSMSLSFLWRWGISTKNLEAQRAVLLSLTRMASGGIFDQLGGGFHRYSVDDTWSVPHFEKMLYDNALLLKLYSEVLLSDRISVEERKLYTAVVEQTVDYVLREMTHPEGGFYAAQDADSEGEEGKYFAWDLKDLQAVLTDDEVRAFAAFYGVKPGGNFEHGKTVLYRAQGMQSEVEPVLVSARQKLKAARDARVAPGLDNKILVGWNGLMISGMCWAAQVVSNGERARGAARKAFDFLTKQVSRPGGRLSATVHGGNGYLDDYAFLAQGALDLVRWSTDPSEMMADLAWCRQWVDAVIKHFRDDQGPGYFFTSDDHETLIQRPKTLFDQAIPSGTAVILEVMAALESYDQEVAIQLGQLFESVRNNPFGMGELLACAFLVHQGPVVISGGFAHRVVRHPHVFQKPYGVELRDCVTVCHRQTCSAPLGSYDEAMLALSDLQKH